MVGIFGRPDFEGRRTVAKKSAYRGQKAEPLTPPPNGTETAQTARMPISRERRQFPRRIVQLPAALNLRRGPRWLVVQVSIECLSAEGMGLSLYIPKRTLEPRTLISLELAATARPLEIPATVAWHASRSDGTSYLGAHLMLQLTSASERRRIVEWMSEQFARAGAGGQGPTLTVPRCGTVVPRS